MSKAVKVFVIYILLLILCSFIFSRFNISSDFQNIPKSLYEVRLIIIPTIIGGIIALKYTVPHKPFRIFLVVYSSLWILRYTLLFVANKLGEVHVFNTAYHLDIIIANYYRTASRLETPLPFVIFWFIYYFYTRMEKKSTEENHSN